MRILISLASTCILINIINCSDTNYRLNTPINPISYSLSIRPYFDTADERAFTFDGEVSIRLTTSAATNKIKLHSEDLNFSIENVVVIQSNVSDTLMISNLTFEETYSFVHINLTTELQPRFDYEVKIDYKGPIRDDLNGFYKNYYLEGGVKKWLGATQMEPTHARKVFPCFDEPELKATFTLTIDRPQNFKPSLTNTYMQSSNNLTDGYVRETFHTTPRMSTYLVAFLVSEFEPAHIVDGTREFGVFTRPEAKNQSDYAFDFGRRVVDALSSYFGIDYYSSDSNLRLDHVALPDFKAGAMENWGLIKYREALLLFVPEVSTPYYKYRVAQIMAHETTHMWFGNLVTCHWWSNTWLNEGFANYFQDYITALIEPELSSDSILVTGSVYAAYDADDAPTSPAITNDKVNSPAEISAHFGTITYQKAGSVIRMIHHLVSDDAFKYGLNLYLKNNSFNAGYPYKMYAALNDGVMYYNNTLSAYPGVSVTNVMNSWVSQPGHPVLNVNVNYETETVTLNQKRFLINSTYESDEIYKIPITFATEMSPDFTNTKPTFIMENKTLEFSIADIGKNHSWVIFNVQETGLYRVNYDLHSWQIISAALKGENSKKIHHLNRAKIVNDLFAFLYADEISFSTLHDVLEILSTETDYSVWYAALKGLNKLQNNYLGDETLIHIQKYILRLLESGIKNVGYEVKSTDDFETLRNRMQILEFACKLVHEGCIEHTIALFRSLKQNGTEISPSLRPVAYCNGLRYGDGDDYEFLWHRMMTTNVASEARIIGDALGCTSDEEKLKSYLVSMLVENSAIRTQDLTVPLSSVLSNYSHLHVVMDSLKENYTLWTIIYPSMDTVLSTIASVLRSENDFNEFETWLASCSQCGEDVKTAATNTLNLSKASRSWAEDHKADILQSITNMSLKSEPSLIMIIAGLLVFFTAY